MTGSQNDIDEISIVIPSFNPDYKLYETVKGLIDAGFSKIVLVDDGSDESCRFHFDSCLKFPQCELLRHEYNKGKGAALKTAFSLLSGRKELIGVITVDGDGQHSVKDCLAMAEFMLKRQASVILGVRDFDGEDVPKHNKWGNKITRYVFKRLCDFELTDTQSGLRGIPQTLLERFSKIEGDRYEYETNMLLYLKEHNIGFEELKIDTVYDGNKGSHFKVVSDSIRIYRVIFEWRRKMREGEEQ